MVDKIGRIDILSLKLRLEKVVVVSGIREIAPKLTNLVLYICSKMKNAEHFDEAKLNLILWKIDLDWYARTAKSLTEAVYVKGPDGPIPVIEIEDEKAGMR